MLLDAADYGLCPGGIGPLASRLVPITGASKAGQDYSELGPLGLDLPATFTRSSAATLNFDVSDTLLVQWNEDPVNEQFVTVADTVRVTLTDIAALHNRIDSVDTLSIGLSETVALVQSGVTLKTASDTASVTLTESVALSVTLDVSDTCSVTFSGETATVATPVEAITVNDTLSVSVDDASLIEVFTGVLTLAVADDVRVSVVDTAVRQDIVEVTVSRITFRLRQSRIRFTLS